MKKIFVILILIFTGCSSDRKESLSEKFEFLKNDSKVEAEFDFSKNGIQLINDLERQLKLDFCDSSPYVNGTFVLNKEKLTFPLVVYKYCDILYHPRNRIFIHINAKNQVLVDSEFVVEPLENLGNDLIKATENLVKKEPVTTVVYLLQWDVSLDSSIMMKRLIEMFSASKRFLEDYSVKNYNKNIDQLNETELIQLKKLYNPIIGIEQGINVIP